MQQMDMPSRCAEETMRSIPQAAENVESRHGVVHDASMNDTQVPPTITVHQAARALQVQPATIYNWIRADEFPHLRLGGRIRIPTARLADLLGVTPREIIDGLGSRDVGEAARVGARRHEGA